ncbi:MAG: glycosyltransferase family A protein [Chitinophagaceae bacterium]
MNAPIISVVIPCYNQGKYLKDALDSLHQCDHALFEIIIVNDGSTDEFTNQYIEELSKTGYHVIFQQNTGLGGARNSGIHKAAGKYILPLDADNKIYPAYLERSISILDNNENIAVVYGNANYIGGKKGVLKPGQFNLQRLMLGNYIDACAVIRKSVIEEVGFFENMKIMGYEDWDLWLRIGFKGYAFQYLDEVLFDYRVSADSMMKTLNASIQQQNEIETYFLTKYKDKLSFDFVYDYMVYRFKKKPFKHLYKILLKKFFPAYYNELVNHNKIYKGFLYD